ncbi:NUDIX hydrolase [Burkholderia sp. JSH-S8]|uniref:NUDIX hydrolase n=1 Tax=Burkholderia stagnalis TaxID=1503054 RepID=UPI000F8086D4|nr:NUDIX hydrolase [Burkholderia stagnalis]WGS40531.1 NUDIX hydrolase [Burkholderia sp. JSH-S8]
MAQTYAVVYDSSSRNFFIAVKNRRSFFYHTNGGRIFPPNGVAITHGPGLPALPGGGLESPDPAIGAANEFQEETGVELRQFHGEVWPKEWHQGSGKSEYYGVYFKFSLANFKSIGAAAITNLVTGVNVARAIANGQIKSYPEIFNQYPNCPPDNELASGEIWNLDKDWAKIEALGNDENTDWFYSILLNLRNVLNGKAQS